MQNQANTHPWGWKWCSRSHVAISREADYWHPRVSCVLSQLPAFFRIADMATPLGLQVSVAVLYTITFVAALVGNVFVMYIILRKPNARTTVSSLFFNMAVADLLVCLILMPMSLAFYFVDSESPLWIGGLFGDILCRFVFYVFAVALAASIFTLMVMAFDRFRAIKYPFQSLSRRFGWRLYTAVIWVTSLLCMSPMLVISSNKSGGCDYDWSLFHINSTSIRYQARASLFTFFMVVLYAIPLILLSVLYSVICYTLWKNAMRMDGLNMTEDTMRTRNQEHKSRVKMLITIVVVFALCWLPLHAFHLVAWGFNPRNDVPQVAMFLCFWIGHANSAINPWMYMYLDAKFRVAFLEIIGLRRPQPRSNSRTTATSAARSRGVSDSSPFVETRVWTVNGEQSVLWESFSFDRIFLRSQRLWGLVVYYLCGEGEGWPAVLSTTPQSFLRFFNSTPTTNNSGRKWPQPLPFLTATQNVLAFQCRDLRE